VDKVKEEIGHLTSTIETICKLFEGHSWSGLPIPEDLIILKAVAQRPQDLLDIEGIIKSQKNLNKRYILKHLEEFSYILDMPEIYQTVKKLLSKRKSL
jgi:hypothetical protein